MGGFRIRAGREEDIEQLIEIGLCAYPDSGGYERRKLSLTQNPFGTLGDVRVIEKDGRIAGQAALFALEVWLGGRTVPVGGIASVAIAPEARRLGIARALIEELHTEVDTRKGAFTLLYPFREGFYASFGYATAGPLVSLRVALDAVALAAPATALEGFTLVPLEGALVPEAQALYEDVARREAGRIVRGETRWVALFAADSRHWMGVVAGDGKLYGYAAFSYDVPMTHNRQTLLVHEIVAKDARARRALLAGLARQRDQVDDAEITVPINDPLAYAFFDAPGSRRGKPSVQHPLGTLGAGPMVRLADVGRALALRGYAADGDVTFIIEDRGKRAVRLIVKNGVAEVQDGKGSPEIELSRALLGSIAVAGIVPSGAAELGLLRADPAAIRMADQIFSGPRFQCLDPF